MEPIKNQKHTKETLLFATSRMLERASYYGLRALIVLYMTGETLNLSRTEAITVYGWFTGSFIISQIIGALLGDLVIGNKKSIIIGGITQAIGAFILSIPTLTGLYIGISLITLGSGLFIPNILSNFGKSYLNKPKLLDSGFTLLYLAINIGAILGVFSIGLIGEGYGWNLGFITAGILMLLAIIPIVYSKDYSQPMTTGKKETMSQRILYIALSFTLVGIFWAINEVRYFGVHDLQMKISEFSDLNIPRSLWSSLDSVFSLPLSIIAILVWSYYYSNQFVKLTIGFVFGAISFSLLLFISVNPSSQSLILYLLALLFLGISEIHIAPIINSILTRYANPKYLAILMSLVIVPMRLFSLSIMLFSSNLINNPSLPFQIGLITMLLVSIGLIVFGVWKRNTDNTETSAHN